MYHFYYIDSSGIRHKIDFNLNTYHSVMELIWDQGFEDWGDCRGRAWCGTCHIKVEGNLIHDKNSLNLDERKCLNTLFNRTNKSRLSCQIQLSEIIHGKEIVFLGD